MSDKSSSPPLTPSDYTCSDFSDIATCFQRLHTHVDCQITSLSCELKGLKERTDAMEGFITYANDEFKAMHGEIVPNLEDKIGEERRERLQLELWGRKWNLVVRGVEGSSDEKPRDTAKKFRNFMKNVLKIEEAAADQMILQAVHRLPSGPDENRNLIVRFSSLMDRDDVLYAATKLSSGSGYSVVPDLPPEIATIRYELLKERHGMPAAERKKTKLVYMKKYPFVALKRLN